MKTYFNIFSHWQYMKGPICTLWGLCGSVSMTPGEHKCQLSLVINTMHIPEAANCEPAKEGGKKQKYCAWLNDQNTLRGKDYD